MGFSNAISVVVIWCLQVLWTTCPTTQAQEQAAKEALRNLAARSAKHSQTLRCVPLPGGMLSDHDPWTKAVVSCSRMLQPASQYASVRARDLLELPPDYLASAGAVDPFPKPGNFSNYVNEFAPNCPPQFVERYDHMCDELDMIDILKTYATGRRGRPALTCPCAEKMV
jgi:hypothetical protein